MEKIKSTNENVALYKTEYFVPGNRRVKMSLSYPVGEGFLSFYEELACGIKDWAAREYSEYSGRGIIYRFSASITHSDELLTSVLCRVSVHERGAGQIAQNIFAQNFLCGKLFPISVLLSSKDVSRKAQKHVSLFALDGILHFVSNNGEICKTDIKISHLYQKNSAYLLKKIT